MSELSELIGRTEIGFPRGINFEQVEGLFDFLSENSIDVRYNVTIMGVKTNRGSEFSANERYVSDISGTMTNFSDNGNFGMGSFFCIRNPEFMENNFSGIKFQTIPGYEIEEHNSQEVILWDKVKKLTEKYFSNKRGCVYVV